MTELGLLIAVPEAIGSIAGNNGCRKVTTDSLCSMRDPQRLITRTVHSGAPSGREVVLCEIHGGKHSWADKDLPTAEIIWNFFSSRLTGPRNQMADESAPGTAYIYTEQLIISHKTISESSSENQALPTKA